MVAHAARVATKPSNELVRRNTAVSKILHIRHSPSSFREKTVLSHRWYRAECCVFGKGRIRYSK